MLNAVLRGSVCKLLCLTLRDEYEVMLYRKLTQEKGPCASVRLRGTSDTKVLLMCSYFKLFKKSFKCKFRSFVKAFERNN